LLSYFIAFSVGALAGIFEIGSRYKDEQIKIAFSYFYAYLYWIINGLLGAFALFLMQSFPEKIPQTDYPVMNAIIAGLGALAILRLNFLNVKNAKGEETGLGLGTLITAALSFINSKIDKDRAADRRKLCDELLKGIQDYSALIQQMIASLDSFQDLSDEDRQTVQDKFTEVRNNPSLTPRIRATSIFYTILNLTGEKHIKGVINAYKSHENGGD
tara:strand:- start:788 stop:1432 length:645 start_codon:yes stop_codon:yes gene_type:complete